jgi:hypothetical protein
MKKFFLPTLLSFFLIAAGHAQPLIFSKFIESPAMRLFKKQAYDPAGYWFFMDDARIMKVDTTGAKKWEKAVSADPLFILRTIHYTRDHRFLITAFHLTTETLHIMTIDSDGDILKTVTAPSSFGEHIFIGEDSVLVVGQRDHGSGKFTGFADLVDSKTGNRLWAYTGSGDVAGFNGATRLNTKVIGLYGQQGGPGQAKAVLTALDLQGHEQWTSLFSASTNATITDVVEGYDHSLKALLWTGNSSELLSLAEDGAVKERRAIPLAIGRYIIRNEQDHTFLITGTSRNRIFLAKADDHNNILWWRFYGSDVKSEFGDAVQGCALLNASIVWWGARRRDTGSWPFLIRTDDQGLVQRTLPAGLKPPQQKIAHFSGSAAGHESQLLTSVQTGEGEVLTGGFHYQKLPGYAEPVAVGLFAKVNASGDTLWTKNLSSTLDPAGYYVNFVVNGKKTSGGDYVLLVQGRSPTSGSMLLHVKPDGKISWNSTVLSGKRTDLVETSPGEFLSCGHAFDVQRYNEKGVFHRIDLNDRSLNILPASLLGSMVHTIIPSGKGTFYVTGEQIETYKVARKGYWAETDASGVVLKSTTYDLAYKTMINATALTAHGNLICAGAVEDDLGNKDMLLMMIDVSGNIVWQRKIDVLHQDEALAINVLPDGYLVAGETGKPVFGLQESYAFAAKFTTEGSLVWQKFIGVPGLYSRAVMIHPDTDSTVVLTGNSEERHPGLPSFGNAAFIETMKMDNEVVTHVGQDKTPLPAAYPNPFSGKLHLSCSGNCTATLITLQGQVAGRFSAEAETTSLTLDASGLAEGLYLVDVKDGDQRYRFRVLKLK